MNTYKIKIMPTNFNKITEFSINNYLISFTMIKFLILFTK